MILFLLSENVLHSLVDAAKLRPFSSPTKFHALFPSASLRHPPVFATDSLSYSLFCRIAFQESYTEVTALFTFHSAPGAAGAVGAAGATLMVFIVSKYNGC